MYSHAGLLGIFKVDSDSHKDNDTSLCHHTMYDMLIYLISYAYTKTSFYSCILFNLGLINLKESVLSCKNFHYVLLSPIADVCLGFDGVGEPAPQTVW